MVILTPPSHKLRDLSGPVDTSSQVSALDDAEMAEASLEEVPTTLSPIAETSGPSCGTPPADASQLWVKANKALGELLATKSSTNVHRQKVVWELAIELCWNNSETMESIKEARAICTHATLDAEVLCSATVKEAKATHAHTIQEANALCSATVKEAKATHACTIMEAKTQCSTAIRGVEIQGASQADSFQWRHVKTIQCLEEQVIQEEGESQTNFLSACQAALQASPVELRGMLIASYHLLMGQAPTSHPFTLSQGASPNKQPSAPAAHSPPAPEHSPRPKWWHPSLDPVDAMPLGGTTSKATSEGPPAPNSKRFYLYTWC